MENKYFITMEELIKKEREASHMKLIVNFLKHNKEVIISILLDKLTNDTSDEHYNRMTSLTTGIRHYASNGCDQLMIPIEINESLFEEITKNLNCDSSKRFVFEVGDDLEIDGVKIKYNFLEGFKLKVIKIIKHLNRVGYTMELYLNYKLEPVNFLNKIGNTNGIPLFGSSNCNNDAFKNSHYHNNPFESLPIGLRCASGPTNSIGCSDQPFTHQNPCINFTKSAEPIFNDENFEIDLDKLEIEKRICEIELNTSIVDIYQWFNFAKRHKLFNLAIHIKRTFNMVDDRVFD